MEAEIGSAAGTVWRHLDQHGATTLTKLKQGTRLPEPLLLMAIGWLAKEGKLAFGKSAKTVQVSLKDEAAA
jgi:hypothetical protein